MGDSESNLESIRYMKKRKKEMRGTERDNDREREKERKKENECVRERMSV